MAYNERCPTYPHRKASFGRLERKEVLLCLLLSVGPHAAFSQFNSGTVGALIYSGDRAIFATDSRLISLRRDRDEVRDDDCKLATSKNKFAFTMAGVSGDNEWDTFASVRSAADRILSSASLVNTDVLDRIIDEFFTDASRWIRSLGVNGVREVGSALGGDALINAVFCLATDSGPIACKILRTFARIEGGDRLVISDERVMLQVPSAANRADGNPITQLAIGKTQTIDEMLIPPESRPEYWKEEMARWPLIQDPVARMRTRAKRMIEVSIAHARDNTVGGHVNSLELSRDGIRWLTDNKECRTQ
jgi:hypothetical protein